MKLLEKYFGFELKSDKALDKKQENLKSFIPPNLKDGGITIDQQNYGFAGQFSSAAYNASQIANEFQLITKYRQMALHPIIDKSIEEICNEAIVSDGNSYTLNLNLDNVDLSEPVKEQIFKEFQYIMDLSNYRNDAYDLFRQFYIDGRMYNYILIDSEKPKTGIQDIRYMDPRHIQLIRTITRKPSEELNTYSSGNLIKLIDEVDEFFVFNPYGIYNAYISSAEQIQGVRLSPSTVSYVTSGLTDAENKVVLSFLEKSSRVLNQLSDLEDSVVIYRLSRAAEKRIFYIDVGKMPHTKASQYLKAISEKYKTKIVYDPASGAVSTKNNQLAMTEDYFLPRREGSTGTEISTLPGGENLGKIDDLDYFNRLLLKSLNVPLSRLDSSGGFDLGKASEITRDEVAFKKFISRLQNNFGQIFLDLLKIQLELKGVMPGNEFEGIKNRIQLDFDTDNFFFELKETEILQLRAEAANNLATANETNKVYSNRWIKKNIFKLTDEQIAEMDKEIAEEKLLNPPEEDPDKNKW